MNRSLPLLALALLLCICSSFENDKAILAQVYIDKYKDLAQLEMKRSGIPASITLAQGLHESNYGTSRLATEANNHFGIKCKSYWQGKTYMHKDDDYNKHGQLMKSCFRAYEIDLDSYVDHTNFLKFTPRYQSLFQLSHTDYINWAHGLKKCGYATDKNYATKLIHKIEKYQLHIFDRVDLQQRI